MRLVVFLFILVSIGTIELTRVDGRPTGIYKEISLFDEISKVKKREDSSRVYLEQCGIVEFPNARRGVVNVLAFLDSSWPYSHRQAIMLKMLSNRLRKSGLTDIFISVVNVSPYSSRKINTMEDAIEREAWLGVSPDEIEEFARINKTFDSFVKSMDSDIDIIQDNEELGIWKLLGGSRDQVLVIDRCGKLTYQVIVPWSILHFPYVKAAILSTYNDQPCEACSLNEESELQENLKSTSTSPSLTDPVTIESPMETESPFKENFVSTSDNLQTETTTLASIFLSNADMATVIDSIAPNLINENENLGTEQPETEKNEGTTSETLTIGFKDETLILEIADDVSTISPEVNTSGYGQSTVETSGSTLKYKSTQFEEKITKEMPDFVPTEMTINFSASKMATASLEDLIDFGSKNADYGSASINENTSPGSTLDSFVRTTSEAIFETTEVRNFEDESATKVAESTLDSVTDSMNFDDKNMNFGTTNNYQEIEAKEDDTKVFTTMKNVLESNPLEILSLKQRSGEINDLSTTIEIPMENEENGVDSSSVPLRIIMHAPHFHVDTDSTRMHEYLVMKTGSLDTHRHLASQDATRLYHGPQDHQEIKMADSAVEAVEKKQWPMKNLIFTKDESTGLFGEVADYWRDLSSLENYDEPEETERPDNGWINEEGPTNKKLWDESSTAKNENSKTPTESLATSEIVTETQPITRTGKYGSEEEEARYNLIAHYSKLLPWIYYVLDE